MEKLKVNLNSWQGKILNIFLLGVQPKTTCTAFWAIVLCSAVWLLQGTLLLVIPVYLYGAALKGTLVASDSFVIDNLSTLWFYPFPDPFPKELHELLFALAVLELATIFAVGVIFLIIWIIATIYNLGEKYPKLADKLEDLKHNPGVIRSSIKGFSNKVCRPISWTRKHDYD